MNTTESATEVVAAEIRAQMARRRYTQKLLADTLGVSQAGVSRRLAGEQDITVPELSVIAELFGMSVSELLHRAYSPTGGDAA
jgi:transcriptional regulator with XRE-family HTH domain